MPVLDLFPRQRTDVAARVIEGEAVVVTPRDGQVHELDAVATFIWEACDGRLDGHGLVAKLTEAYEVAPDVAARDLADLLQAFETKGLVELLPVTP